MGWCRLPDWAASDAVRVHSKHGATVHHPGCSLAVNQAAASDRLLDSSHGASIDGTCQWGCVVELVEITAIVILSVGVGLAGAGALLSMVFLCFTRPARLRTSAASQGRFTETRPASSARDSLACLVA